MTICQLIRNRNMRKKMAVKAEAARRMQEVEALTKHGGDRKSEAAQNQVGNANLVSAKGTTADYLAARIKRDRPDIAARVEAGERAARDGPGVPEGQGHRNAAKDKSEINATNSSINLAKRTPDAHTLKRLKRDLPEVAERVTAALD